MIEAKDIKQHLLRLESSYPVDQWVVNGIKVWPYLRIKLFIDLLKYSKQKPISNLKNTNFKPPKKTIKKQLFQVFKDLFYLLRFLLKLESKSVIYFGGHFHRTKIDGVYFNRFFDALSYNYGLSDNHYTFEFLKIYNRNFYQSSILDLTSSINAYNTLQKIKSKILRQRKVVSKVSLDGYEEFLKDVSQLNRFIVLDSYSELSVTRWVKKIINLQPFFKIVYKRIQPKYVIYAGYYGYDHLYASIYAANSMGINTVDVQHGPQTNTHMVFSDWNKIPEKGYRLMPKSYWNWDEPSKKNILKWGASNGIEAKCIGQPYINYFNSTNKVTISKQSYILYSFQAKPFLLTDFLSDSILSLIKALDYIWILRLHPSSYITKVDVEEFVKSKGLLEKVKIEDAKSSPLPISILKSTWHVTHFSGCVIEALMLDTPSIIINDFGQTIYKDYIDQKKVFYVDHEAANFVSLIKNIMSNPPKSKIFKAPVYLSPFSNL